MKKRYLLMTVVMGILFLFGAVAWAHEVSVFDNQENLIIRAYSSTPATDQTCTPGPFCVNLEVRDPNSTPTSGNLMPLAGLVGLNANPLQVHADASTDDLSLAFDDKTGTTFLFCKNGNFMVMTYNIGRAGTPTCASFTYSSWGTCQANGTQTRTATGSPAGCAGTPDQPLSQSCTPTCASFTYSAWGTCVNGTQTRTATGSPAGCAGTPDQPLSQSCTTGGVPNLVASGLTGISSSFNAGDPYNMSWTVTNNGTAPAGPFKVTGYQNGSYNAGGIVLFVVDVAGLAPGQSYSATIPIIAKDNCGVHDTCYFMVVADSGYQITESIEYDNKVLRSSLRTR